MKTQTLPQLIAEHVRTKPNVNAVRFFDANDVTTPPHVITYEQLWRRANHAVDTFDHARPGNVLLLVMPLGPELLVTHVAGMLKSCIVSIYTTPSSKISDEVYRHNLSHALTKIRPDAVVTTAAFAPHITDIAGDANVHLIVLDDEAMTPFADESDMSLPDDPHAPVILQHSSGSTGLQKGVQLSHAKVIQQCENYGKFIDYDIERDIVCSWLPLYHDMGLFTSWLMPLVLGGTVCLLDPFTWAQKPGSILELASQERGTLIWQPNFAFNLLADRVPADKLALMDLQHLRGITNCSEPVHQDTMGKFQSRFDAAGVQWQQLWSCYAMAENAFAVTATRGFEAYDAMLQVDAVAFADNRIFPARHGQPIKTIATCGRPIDDCSIRIVDDRRNVLADRMIGEIAISSLFLFDEYLHNPKATQAAFDNEGWYHTGDLGFMDSGHLYVTGRIKDLIIVGGRNFYPQDIESIANTIEGVVPGRTVALGIENDSLGTEGVIVIAESREENPAVRDKISAMIRRQVVEDLDCSVSNVFIAPHMWLSKTSSGKIARQKNLARYLETQAKDHAERSNTITPPPQQEKSTPAKTPTWVAVAWGGALGLAFSIYLVMSLWSVDKSWVIYAGF